MLFEPHSDKQERAIFTKKRILLNAAGTQWGKTRVGAVRMKQKIHTYTDKDDNFLITSPTYKTLHQSTLPAFLKIMDGCGSYNHKYDEFRIKNGGTVYCRTETDPDSIIGITNIKHIWGDEAGKYRLYFWENIQARAEFFGSGIDLTTSPYSMNWIPKELIKPTMNGLRNDVEFVQAASWENPYHSLFDPEKREAKRRTMDQRRFDMIFGGEFGQMAGLVFDCFDEELHSVEPCQLPAGTKYYGGIDWGYSHPFVIVIRAVTPTGHHFQVSEFYKTGMTPSAIIEACKQRQSVFNVQTFYADPSRPDYIKELNNNGVPCLGAENEIEYGIGRHYDLIKTGRYKIFKGTSPHTIDEYASYHYPEPEDLGPDDKDKEQLPVDQNNHACDANRYVTVATYRAGDKRAPKVPDENKKLDRTNHEKRLNQLKRAPRSSRGSESWS